MTAADQLAILEQIRTGLITPADAQRQLTGVASFDFATIDLDRQARCGFPEVVFAEGKTCEWLTGTVDAIFHAGQDCLATRINDEQSQHLGQLYPKAEQDRLARTFWLPIRRPIP